MTFRAVVILIALLCSAVAGFFVSYYIHRTPDDIVMESSGLVAFHSPLSFVKQIEHDPEAGRKIFNEFCSACHAEKPIIDVHAPRLHDCVAWRPIQSQSHASLLKITINGKGAMPARGGCFECSDKQLKQTIEYISKENKNCAAPTNPAPSLK